MRLTALTIALFICSGIFAQKIDEKLSAAVKALEVDPQFKHAILSMYVVDNKTGAVVFEKNSQLGLAPASCQKVVTSVSAFEMLGNNYRYKTMIKYSGTLKNGFLDGDIYITATGDPTLGSWRWASTTMDSVKRAILEIFKRNGIQEISGEVRVDQRKWETQATPNGWTWDDIGNYYGAGARTLNWHENQYDIILKPGKKEGDPVELIRTEPRCWTRFSIVNELMTGKEGSGDNSIIYLQEGGGTVFLRGTVPAGKDSFIISGSMPVPVAFFIDMIGTDLFKKNKILEIGDWDSKKPDDSSFFVLDSITSPSLDSINYWFLKRSVNLYGEALVKTIAYEKTRFGATDAGVTIIKNFWKDKGIEPSALHIIDGSGLSPANRVTTNALVTIMQYAKNQSWFPSFYNALPELNGIKMKDGYISGVRAFTGYVKSKDGNEYTFSFIVNNFDGSAGTVREKMWRVLDILK